MTEEYRRRTEENASKKRKIADSELPWEPAELSGRRVEDPPEGTLFLKHVKAPESIIPQATRF